LTPNQTVARGILPAEIKSLVDSRKEVKKLMNDPKISNVLKEQVNYLLLSSNFYLRHKFVLF